MSFGDWMVPELSVNAELQLEYSKRLIRANVRQKPEEIAELTCSLTQQLMLYQSIVRKATHRIAELELTTVLFDSQVADPPAPDVPTAPYCCAPAGVPWPLRWVLRLYGYQVAVAD